MTFLEVVGSFALGVGAIAAIAFIGLWVLAKLMGMPKG